MQHMHRYIALPILYSARNPIIEQAFTQLTNKLYGIVGALGSALPISLPGADEVCKLGASCPVSAGTRNVQIIHIVVQPVWPDVKDF